MKGASLFGVIGGILVLCLLIAGSPTIARAWDSGYNATVTSGKTDKQERLQTAVQVMLKQASTQHAQLNQWHKKQRDRNAASLANLPVQKAGVGLAMGVSR